MPLDVLGRTRATLMCPPRLLREDWINLVKAHRDGDRFLQFNLERGIPSRRKSSACIDYVPALCTHRPSLLPIEWSGKLFGLRFAESFVNLIT